MKKNFKFDYLYFVAILLVLISLLGVFSVFLNKNNTDNSNNESEIVESIDFSSMRYLALGDSITWGAYRKSLGKVESGGYPEMLKEELKFKDVINYGVSGQQTDKMIELVDKMAVNGDIVSVMGGINDCFRDVPIGTFADTGTETFYGRIKLLAVKLKSKYSNSFVFFMTPYQSILPSCTTGNKNGNVLIDYVNVIIEVCSFYDIPVLDMYHYGQFELEMNNADSDGTHPSVEFFEEYTIPQIAQFIKDNYKK